MIDAIGGYFSLELNKKLPYHKGKKLLSLNTARNCLEYILEAKDYKLVHIPYFTCEVILEPLKKLNIDYKFYSIDEKLEPIFDFHSLVESEAFLYTNYFGIKDSYINKLSTFGINLIIDNAQSFFSLPINGIDTFYSARKFVGVSDGAYLFTDKHIKRKLEQDQTFNRMEHLLKRLDTSAEEGYATFSENDQSLVGQPIKIMSKLTESILNSVDFEFVKSRRLANFRFLHNNLKQSNQLIFNWKENQIPMVYPYWTKDLTVKKRLQKQRIYCATYWPNIKECCNPESLEYRLMDEVVYLPIDQRYGKVEMQLIINIIQS
jgi:hypothetical protein